MAASFDDCAAVLIENGFVPDLILANTRQEVSFFRKAPSTDIVTLPYGRDPIPDSIIEFTMQRAGIPVHQYQHLLD